MAGDTVTLIDIFLVAGGTIGRPAPSRLPPWLLFIHLFPLAGIRRPRLIG